MTIRGLKEKQGFGCLEGVNIGLPFQGLNIGFINHDGKLDETDLEITCPITTEYGIRELEELWESLADEMDADVDSIEYIDVIYTA